MRINILVGGIGFYKFIEDTFGLCPFLIGYHIRPVETLSAEGLDPSRLKQWFSLTCPAHVCRGRLHSKGLMRTTIPGTSCLFRVNKFNKGLHGYSFPLDSPDSESSWNYLICKAATTSSFLIRFFIKLTSPFEGRWSRLAMSSRSGSTLFRSSTVLNRRKARKPASKYVLVIGSRAFSNAIRSCCRHCEFHRHQDLNTLAYLRGFSHRTRRGAFVHGTC